jgi:hypothetical protein
MSLADVLAELPSFTAAERQLLIQRALDLDDAPLSPQDEAVVRERLEEYHRNPNSALSLDEMKSRLRSRFPG